MHTRLEKRIQSHHSSKPNEPVLMKYFFNGVNAIPIHKNRKAQSANLKCNVSMGLVRTWADENHVKTSQNQVMKKARFCPT